MKNVKFYFLFCFVFTHLLHAQFTTVPDDNFEQALIDLGYDNVLDNLVLTANIQNITELDVFNKNIHSLTGIEGFTSLQKLTCSINQLTTLDLSNNLNLKMLFCSSNLLTILNVTNNIALETLHCDWNHLNNIDLSNNLLLSDLLIHGNQLTSLNVSNNISLKRLFCSNNLLSNLDVSLNVSLIQFACDQNNQLTSLNLKNGNNTNFIFLYANQNPLLTCVQVDNAAYSETNWRGGGCGYSCPAFDTWASFNENCNLLSLQNSIKNKINIYPNPTKDKIHFKDFKNISKVNIYDMQGKLIKTSLSKDNYTDLSSFNKGIYYVEVFSDGKSYKTKVIKE